ncbi:MAG: undecaprenyldiphospho-muramoylpentapeptide beta-N-acetylglucosaminyltransferase [Flavobacteriales bacterium]|nr:MAG: undecaprenyldiphospho-muramoylpentapeptide beta-N-acetylglucosaminyltransferase [Flavobacteriales bacterium]
MKPSIKILISGGGTGGHIYPALAIADELKKRHPKADFLFVGAKGRMEMEKVPNAGYKIIGLWISGIQRKQILKNLSFPFKLLSSLFKANKILKNFKPDVTIGTGGFASGPVLQMANKRNIPTLIQEQNSYPGITNKLLAKKANTICVAYDGLERFFPKEKLVKTGNPVRSDVLNLTIDKKIAIDHFLLTKESQVLLVLGGSLGARAINNLMQKHIHWLVKQGLQVIWQTGKLYYEEFKQFNDLPGVRVVKFIDRMEMAYTAADIIISRAGAGSISELCLVGKPVLFIPSPNVAEDHQAKNAMAVAQNKGAVMLRESELNRFKEEFVNLILDKSYQKMLGTNIKKMAMPNATEQIADEVEKLIELSLQ